MTKTKDRRFKEIKLPISGKSRFDLLSFYEGRGYSSCTLKKRVEKIEEQQFFFSFLLLRFIDRRVVNAAVIVIISYCDRNHEDWWASREFDV